MKIMNAVKEMQVDGHFCTFPKLRNFNAVKTLVEERFLSSLQVSLRLSSSILNPSMLFFSLLLVLLSVFLSPFVFNRTPISKQEEVPALTVSSIMSTTEIFGVKIEKNPPQSKLDELGVFSWPTWSCEPSKIPWTFKATETMYLLEGKVKVYVEGHEGSFEIGAGDFVVFPKGMKITWDALEAVNKHYSLEE